MYAEELTVPCVSQHIFINPEIIALWMEQTYSLEKYLFVLTIVITVVLFQYLIPTKNLLLDLFTIYIIPILFISVFFGRLIIEKSFKNNKGALIAMLISYSISTIIASVLAFIIVILLLGFIPGSLYPLARPSPQSGSSQAAIAMVIISLAIVGPAEEYIFRGFVFGALYFVLQRKHWLPISIFSSIVFTVLHAYYYFTFGIASSIFFVQIFSISLAFSIAYFISGGNLLMPALIHGIYDASAFLDFAAEGNIGAIIRSLIFLSGIILAIMVLI